MEDEPLRRLIAELPRERARPGFTAAVLRRLAEPERPALGLRSWQLSWVGAALVALIVGGGGWGFSAWQQQREADEARRMVEEIKQEHARLAREVRELDDERRPVVYVGGNEEVDLVVDLSQISPEQRRVRVVPAAQTTETF